MTPFPHVYRVCVQWRYLRAAMVLRVDALRGIPREPWQRAPPSTLAPPPFLPLSTTVTYYNNSSSSSRGGSAHMKYVPTSAPDDAATRPKSPARKVAAPVYVAGLYRFKAAGGAATGAGAGGRWAARAAMPVDEDAVAKTRACLSARPPRAKQEALTDAPAAWAGWETSLDERRRQDGQVLLIFSYSPLFSSPSDRLSFLYMHNTRSGGQPSWWC
jgi:hypothetical protein